MLRVQVIFLQAQIEFINAGEKFNLLWAHLLRKSREFSMASKRGSGVWVQMVRVRVRVRVGAGVRARVRVGVGVGVGVGAGSESQLKTNAYLQMIIIRGE
jgi:hypothetical protein